MRYILEFINHIYPHNPVFVAYVKNVRRIFHHELRIAFPYNTRVFHRELLIYPWLDPH